MTPLQRQQLEQLVQEQKRLIRQVDAFGDRLQQFFADVETMAEAEPALGPAIAMPPPLPVMQVAHPVISEPVAPAEPTGLNEASYSGAAAPIAPAAPAVAGLSEAGGRVATPEPPVSPAPPPRERQSLEMTLGTVWLAR